MNEPIQHYPGAMSAVFITLGGVFAWALVIAFFGPNPDIGAVGVGQALGLGFVATLAARNVPAPQQERLGLCGFDSGFVPTLILLLPVVLLTSELDNWIRAIAPVTLPLAEAAADELASNGSLMALQSAIVVVGIAPVVEEWLFRGVLLQGIVAKQGAVRGLLVTSLLFAMVNVAPTAAGGSPLSILLGSMGLGLIYGLARLATGSLLAPIVLHVGINGLGLAAVSYADSVPIDGFNAPGDHTPISLLLPAMIAVFLGVRGLWQAAQERPATPPLPRHPRDQLRPDDS